MNTIRSYGRALALAFSIAACGGAAHESAAPERAAATTTTAARADESKAVVSRYLAEVWDKKNPAAVSTSVAADLVNHAAIPEAQGARGMKTIATKLLAAFPDLTMHVSGISTDGDDLVVVRAVFEGTHMGLLDFKVPLPATNKHVKVDQVHTFRVKDGKLVEAWMVMDRFELLSQLGALPGAPKPSPP
jgi:predicted ester cyclase